MVLALGIFVLSLDYFLKTSLLFWILKKRKKSVL